MSSGLTRGVEQLAAQLGCSRNAVVSAIKLDQRANESCFESLARFEPLIIAAGLVDHKNRNMRSSNNLGGLAAQKDSLDPTISMGGHDDQVATLLFCRLNDGASR